MRLLAMEGSLKRGSLEWGARPGITAGEESPAPTRQGDGWQSQLSADIPAYELLPVPFTTPGQLPCPLTMRPGQRMYVGAMHWTSVCTSSANTSAKCPGNAVSCNRPSAQLVKSTELWDWEGPNRPK